MSMTVLFVSSFVTSRYDWEAQGPAAKEPFLLCFLISLLPWPTNQVWKQQCPRFTQSLSSKKSQKRFCQPVWLHSFFWAKRASFLEGKWIVKDCSNYSWEELQDWRRQLSHWLPGPAAGPTLIFPCMDLDMGTIGQKVFLKQESSPKIMEWNRKSHLPRYSLFCSFVFLAKQKVIMIYHSFYDARFR